MGDADAKKNVNFDATRFFLQILKKILHNFRGIHFFDNKFCFFSSNKKIFIYLGIQFDGVLSTSQAANNFMGTGLFEDILSIFGGFSVIIFTDFSLG